MSIWFYVELYQILNAPVVVNQPRCLYKYMVFFSKDMKGWSTYDCLFMWTIHRQKKHVLMEPRKQENRKNIYFFCHFVLNKLI